MTPPDTPPPAPRRLLFRWWMLAPVLVVLLLGALAASLAWVATTAAGAVWAIGAASAAAGAGTTIENLRGSFADGLFVDRLAVRHPDADVDVQGLRLVIDWPALWSRRLHVNEVSAARVDVSARPSDTPSEPLRSLRLPLEVDVDRSQIGALDIRIGNMPLPVTLNDIDLSAAMGLQRDLITLSSLRVGGPQAEASLRGQIDVGTDAPFDTKVRLDAQGRQGDHTFDLRTRGTGSLANLAVTLQGNGAGIGVDASAQLALLEGFPLRTLRLQLHGIDPSAWASQAPHANLDVAADLHTSGDQPDLLLQGPFSVTNSVPQPLDRGGLPVARLAGALTLPIQTFQTVDIAGLDIVLNGGGRLTGSLAWKKSSSPDDATGLLSGTLTAADIDASKLHGAAVPTHLSGPIAFTADAASQELKANLAEKGRAVPMSLKLAARIEKSVLTVSQADLAAGDARATVTGELGLDDSRRFTAQVRLDKFDPSYWVKGAGIPAATVSATGKVKGALSPQVSGAIQLSVDPGSRWNGSPLGGRVNASFEGSRVFGVDAALTAGTSHLQATGAFGRVGDKLVFDLGAPQLEALWPGLKGHLQSAGTLADTVASPAVDFTVDAGDLQLPGGVSVGKVQGRADIGNARGAAVKGRRTATASLDAIPADIDLVVERLQLSTAPQAYMSHGAVKLSGTVASHQGSIDAQFVPVDGTSPATLKASLAGTWGRGADGKSLLGWRGTLDTFDASRPPFGMTLNQPVTLSYVPGAEAPQWQWEVGAAQIDMRLPGGQTGQLIHAGSRGDGQRWQTRGQAKGLAWAPDLLFDAAATGKPLPADRMLTIDGDWDLRFEGALQGTAHLQRRSGDLMIPGDPPVPLGLHTASATLQAVPEGAAGHSRVTATIDIEGQRFGRMHVDGQAGVLARDGTFALDPGRPTYADADLDIQDISWASLFVGDSTDLGGKINGKLRIARDAGRWHATGAIDGQDIRVVRVDDGLRLLDGALKATLEDDKIVLDSLHFPGVIRVRPRDSRVTKWIDSDGSGGKLDITANWSLSEASGHATIIADKFPAIQRTDRFVAGSGRVDMDLAPKKMRIAGLFEADAGWINLGTEAPASLSSDVYISRSGATARPEPLGIAIDVGAKLGSRFYLQGYGLDTGLTGDLRVVGVGSALKSSGTVRTQNGQFSAYGQTLTVRRGVVTFQGPLDDPLLDIVALRIGPQVEAGVQISGTARRPVIALISEPEVSDVEKLSWLLLGRGPDDAGGGADAGLLLSAATSLFGPGGEPLSRRLGVDEIGVRSGNIGSTRGLLPERTVAGDSTTSTPQLATQFFIVGKKLSDKVYVSFEQALSGRDGVVRLSYRLTRRLSVVAKGGTLNGLDLLYYVFFPD